MNLYRTLLGDRFDDLGPGVRRAHTAPLVARGEFDVVRGRGPLAGLAAGRMGMPPAGRGVPVEVRLEAEPGGIRWIRRFGSTTVESTQRAEGGLLVERFAEAELGYRLEVSGEDLVYHQETFRLIRGRLPSSLAPSTFAAVCERGGGWAVRVEVTLPAIGLVARYEGEMRADRL